MIPQWNELWTEPNLLIPGKKPIGPVVSTARGVISDYLFRERFSIADVLNNNPATATNCTLTMHPQIGRGLLIGSSGFVTVNSTIIGNHSYSISILFQRNNLTAQNYGLADGLNGTDSGFQIFVLADHTIRIRVDDGASANFVVADTVSTVNDTDVHLYTVVVNKNGNVTPYLDGVQDGTPQDISSFSDISISQELILGRLNASDALEGVMYRALFYNRVLSSAEVRRLYNDYFYGLATPYDLMIPGAGAGGAILVNQSADTNTSQAVAPQRIYNIDQTSEINSAFETTLLRLYSAGLSAESDTAFSSTLQRLYSINQSTESGAAFPVTISGAVAVGLSASLESGLGATVLRSYTVDLGQSTESALSATIEKLISSNQSIEVDSAVAVSVLSEILVGQSQESDLPQPVNSLRIYDINVTTETDSAFGTVIISVAIVVSKGSHTRAVILNDSSGVSILNGPRRSANLLNSGNRYVQ